MDSFQVRFRRWQTVGLTAIRDTLRARGALTANLLTIVGICLPILLLSGLNRGLVEQFRNNILKSPTARQIEVWATHEGSGSKFTRDAITRLQNDIPGLALVIPDIHGSGWLANAAGTKVDVNLACTAKGDPFLQFYGADVLTPGDRGVVISRDLADQLGVDYRPSKEKRSYEVTGGQQRTLLIRRAGEAEPVSLPVEIRGIFSRDNENGEPMAVATVYLERELADLLEDFKKGRSVPELHLAGVKSVPKAQHDGYLAFCKTPLSGGDIELLKGRGLAVRELSSAPLKEPHQQVRVLYGLLKPHKLHVYWFGIVFGADAAVQPVDLPVSEIESITQADDVVLPWSRTRLTTVDGQTRRMIGVTVRGRWLKSYFRDYARTRLEGAPTQIMLVSERTTTPNLGAQSAPPPSAGVSTSGGPGAADPAPVAVAPAREKTAIPVKGTARLTLEREPYDGFPVETLELAAWEQSAAKSLGEFYHQCVTPGRIDTLTQCLVQAVPQVATYSIDEWDRMVPPPPALPVDGEITRQTVDRALVEDWCRGLNVLLTVPRGDSLTALWKSSRLRSAWHELTRRHQAPLAIVPAELASYFSRHEDGTLEYDELLNGFVPARVENAYTKALMFAKVLEDVPTLDTALREMGYSTTSSRTSVEEMRDYVRTLDILFLCIFWIVLLLGVFAVGSAFWDVTVRKRGTIGIVRLMGMSGFHVFVFVFIRALLIGGLAILAALIIGQGTAIALESGWQVACRFSWGTDLALLATCTLCCCILGVAFPAIYAATKLDPVDAISGGRIQ